MTNKKKFPLWASILIGFVFGIVLGGLVKFQLAENAAKFSETYIFPIGGLFLNLIKMLIIPLIFTSIFSGAASIGDPAKLGRVGLKTVGLYLATTIFAVSIGIAVAMIVHPGNPEQRTITSSALVTNTKQVSLSETLLRIVPSNPIKAMVEGNILQIIFFALLCGVAAALCGEKSKAIVEAMQSAAEVSYKMVELVMLTAPLGVAALIAHTICTQGIGVLGNLALLIFCAYLGSVIHAIFIYGGLVKFLSKTPLFSFLKAIFPAQLVAFSTCSSSGTLPASMECCEENLGIDRSISSFVLPLGATINMDGTSLYQGVCVVFVAQMFGVELGVTQLATIVMTATLASIGTAGIPGAGVIMLGMVLSAVGLPLEGVAIVAGVDRILDMARTTLNITGDCAVNLIIASSEKAVHEISSE